MKQDGRVFFNCCRLGHTIKADISLGISLTQVMKVLLTVVVETSIGPDYMANFIPG